MRLNTYINAKIISFQYLKVFLEKEKELFFQLIVSRKLLLNQIISTKRI